MRRFNRSVTKILEDVDLDTVSVDPHSERSTTTDQKFITQVIEQFKEGKIDKDKAGLLLQKTAATTKENKPLSVVADFVDILNRSVKTGNVISTSAIRKLARTLGVKQGALDGLEEADRALALQLIHDSQKQEASRRASTPKMPSGIPREQP